MNFSRNSNSNLNFTPPPGKLQSKEKKGSHIMLTLSGEQIRRIDRLAVEQYAMPSILLMENAGHNAARIIETEYPLGIYRRVVIFCGPGNNGGDGFVIARHLHNTGRTITIILTVPAGKLKGDALTNYQIVSKMPVPILPADAAEESLAGTDLVIDALLGTGFAGEPRPPLDSIIQKINRSGKPVVAVDVPSGLDCSTGIPAQATIRANLTITFVAAKTVFLTPTATPYLGKLQIADIGAPKELIPLVTADPHPEAGR
jgi:NAD(P)H-hydrate epimerase